jgi:hypothetical protein
LRDLKKIEDDAVEVLRAQSAPIRTRIQDLKAALQEKVGLIFNLEKSKKAAEVSLEELYVCTYLFIIGRQNWQPLKSKRLD